MQNHPCDSCECIQLSNWILDYPSLLLHFGGKLIYVELGLPAWNEGLGRNCVRVVELGSVLVVLLRKVECSCGGNGGGGV